MNCMGLKTLQNGLYSLFWPILLDIFISRNGSSYCFLPLKQIFIMLICFMPDLLLLCFLTYITFPYSLQCTLAAGQANRRHIWKRERAEQKPRPSGTSLYSLEYIRPWPQSSSSCFCVPATPAGQPALKMISTCCCC